MFADISLASKTFAEKAAWDFVEKEKPNFSIATINPPLVFGPVVHYLASLEALNTSNQRIRNFIEGKAKEEVPATGAYLWVDVRDCAMAHVKAAEVQGAANKRFFNTAGYFTNKQMRDVIAEKFPEYKDKLPTKVAEGGDFPEGGVYKYNNSQSREILGLEYNSLENCLVDTIKSFKNFGL